MIHSTVHTTHHSISILLTEGMNQSTRTLLNCTAMDIMYYTSPLFRMEIWSALQYELNRLYQMFTARNPTFEANGGKVSIVTHSLGKISSWDILVFPLTNCDLFRLCYHLRRVVWLEPRRGALLVLQPGAQTSQFRQWQEIFPPPHQASPASWVRPPVQNREPVLSWLSTARVSQFAVERPDQYRLSRSYSAQRSSKVSV